MKAPVLTLALMCAGAAFAQTPPAATTRAAQLKKFQVLMQMHAEMHAGHGHFAHEGPVGAAPALQN